MPVNRTNQRAVVKRESKKKLSVAAVTTVVPDGATPEEIVDPFVPCVLGNELYRLKCSWQSLVVASVELKRQGIAVNLMAGLDFRYATPDMVAPLFFAMALAQHPGLKYRTIEDALDITNGLIAFDAVATAYLIGMPKPQKGAKANPPDVQAQK